MFADLRETTVQYNTSGVKIRWNLKDTGIFLCYMKVYIVSICFNRAHLFIYLKILKPHWNFPFEIFYYGFTFLTVRLPCMATFEANTTYESRKTIFNLFRLIGMNVYIFSIF